MNAKRNKIRTSKASQIIEASDSGDQGSITVQESRCSVPEQSVKQITQDMMRKAVGEKKTGFDFVGLAG